jgi:multiple sugar transport system substrate-binding protein
MTSPEGQRLELDNLLPEALATVVSCDGRLHMIPTDLSEVILFYRKDLIPRPPETWDEFGELALHFTRSRRPASPTSYGAMVQGKYEMWTFCAALEKIWSYGGHLFRPETLVPDLDSPETEAALAILEALATAGAFPPGMENAEYGEVGERFLRGDVAMALQWNAFFRTLSDPRVSPQLHDRFDIAPPPGVRLPDGTVRRAMYLQTIGLAINRNSKHKEAAMRFLAWATLGEGARIYARAGGSSPIESVWKGEPASMPYMKLAPWIEAYGRSVRHHPELAELMMIGSDWVQRIIVREATSREAAAGMQKDMIEHLRTRPPT